MTGWRKRTIMEMAREVKMPYDFVTGEPINIENLEAFAELVREDALAQPAPYMAVLTDRMNVDPHTGNVSIGTVASKAIRARVKA
jgi:hypothetical protein